VNGYQGNADIEVIHGLIKNGLSDEVFPQDNVLLEFNFPADLMQEQT
jgi:hypothetical protein